MKACLLLMNVLSVLLFTAGCREQAVYRTKFCKDERLAENATVLVDDIPSGFVKALSLEGDERVAVLVLTDTDAQQKAKAGLVRIMSNDGLVHLHVVGDESHPSFRSPKRFIPTESQTAYTLKKFGSKRALLLFGIAVATLLTICLVFRSLFPLGLVILCMAPAGLTGGGIFQTGGATSRPAADTGTIRRISLSLLLSRLHIHEGKE